MEIRQHYSANRAVLGVHCGVHTYYNNYVTQENVNYKIKNV